MTDQAAASPSLTRAIAMGALLAVAPLAFFASREAVLGHDQLMTADTDAQRGDWLGAVAHARVAAEARVPGSPWPPRAARRLLDVAHQAELRGDDDTALLAYGALRTAALSTRAFAWSEAAWRVAAEEGVARIASRRATATGSTDPHDRASSVREALRREESPRMWALAASNAAAFAMIGALSTLAWAGTNRKWTNAARALFAGGLLIYAIVLLMN